MKSDLEQKHKIIITIHFISSFALILFWSGYYLLPAFKMDLPSFYSGFPNALPLPDSILVVTMMGAGLLILRQDKRGPLLTMMLAAVLIFLGTAGFQLKTESGLLLMSMVSMLKSGFVNLWCIVFGFYFFVKLRERKNKTGVERQSSSSPPVT